MFFHGAHEESYSFSFEYILVAGTEFGNFLLNLTGVNRTTDKDCVKKIQIRNHLRVQINEGCFILSQMFRQLQSNFACSTVMAHVYYQRVHYYAIIRFDNASFFVQLLQFLLEPGILWMKQRNWIWLS